MVLALGWADCDRRERWYVLFSRILGGRICGNTPGERRSEDAASRAALVFNVLLPISRVSERDFLCLEISLRPSSQHSFHEYYRCSPSRAFHIPRSVNDWLNPFRSFYIPRSPGRQKALSAGDDERKLEGQDSSQCSNWNLHS